MEDIYNEIDNRNVKICVLGLGYAGLPLLMAFNKAGFTVYGIDNDSNKVDTINSGRSVISWITDDEIKDFVKKDSVRIVSSDLYGAKLRAQECDFIIGCVPTPIHTNLKPDLNPLYSVCNFLADVQEDNKERTFILESTTFPGCTEKLFGCFKNQGLSIVFSPERIDPGNKSYTLENTPKVVGGNLKDVLVVEKLYKSIISADIVKVSSTRTAEMTKLVENIYRFVNISMSNELESICSKIGINYREALEAAETKPFGFSKFTPTYKIGGHCIGVDPYYFKDVANTFGLNTKILDACTEVNEGRLRDLLDRIKWILDSAGKTISGANIGIVGVSYKKNIDDIRNSAAESLYPVLCSLGANVYYHDPYCKTFENIFSINLEEVCKRCEVVLILTDHDNVDYDFIKQNVEIIIDTKNVYNESWIYNI
jgi:UDP-N-acetyl-D-glucosamine dehydrogenase